MENNNGRGIFYGVMGVATLVVAIVGATFAYFAASFNGTENAASATSTSVSGTITITGESMRHATTLIPTTEAHMASAFAREGSNKCRGVSAADNSQEFDLCSYYTFTVNNTATVPQTVFITMNATNQFENLMYCVYEGTAVSADEGAALVGCTKLGSTVTNATVNTANGVNLPATNGSQQYTMVFYINETNGDQTGTDSGKSFAGTIKASTAFGDVNVTGIVLAG